MASTSSSRVSRRSERHKAVDSDRDGEASIVQSKHSSSNPSSRSHRTSRPVIINEFHGPVSINGNNAFGSARKEDRDHQPASQSPKSTPSNSRKGLLANRTKKEPLDLLAESSSSESSPVSSQDNSPMPIPSRKSRHLPSPSPTRSDRSSPDEGYITGAGMGGPSRRRRGATDMAKTYSSRKDKDETQSRRHREKQREEESDEEDSDASVNKIHFAKEENEEEDDDDSDDDFAHRTIKLEGPNNNEVEIRAILDTGTKPDWVSCIFLEKLKKKHSKIRDDQNTEFRDFNGKRFKAMGTIELNVICEDFQGFKCRKKTFLVSKDSAFEILLGRRTVKEEGLLRVRAPDTSGEGVYPGIQSDVGKAEQAKIAHNRAKQEKEMAEQAKRRDEKRASAKAKERQNPKPVPLANLATKSKPHRRSSPSPSKKLTSASRAKSKDVFDDESSESSPSLDGCW